MSLEAEAMELKLVEAALSGEVEVEVFETLKLEAEVEAVGEAVEF